MVLQNLRLSSLQLWSRMKVPVRKLKTLAQYSILAAFVMVVVFVVANFQDKKLGKPKKKPQMEESAWENLKQEKEESNSEDIPRFV